MKTRIFKYAVAAVLAGSLAACSTNAADSSTATTSGTTTQVQESETSQTQTVVNPSNSIQTALAKLKEAHSVESVDLNGAQKITLSGSSATTTASGVTVKDGTVTISEAGVYELSGDLAGQVVVNAADTDKVTLILNNAEITSQTGSAIAATSVDELTVYVKEGTTNSLTDAKQYADTSDTAPSAALDSASDLSIIGTGTLNVTGNYNDAINTNDGLVIEGVTLNVTAADDGIRGKDYVVINSGEITVKSEGHSIKADNVDDATVGYVAVLRGTATVTSGIDADGLNAQTVLLSENVLTVTSGDDGVHADLEMIVEAKTLTIKESVEGLEAANLVINSGTISVTSSDDALNATSGTTTSTQGGGMAAESGVNIEINGGDITLNSGGDGFDSNGSATLAGGTLIINGPTNDGNGSIDVNGEFTVTGGTLVAAGSGGMAQTPTSTSGQGWVQFNVNVSSGQTATLKDSSGTEILSFTTVKQAQNIVISHPDLQTSQQYTLEVDGSSAGTATAGQSTGGGMGGGMRGNSNGSGMQPPSGGRGMQPPANGERPGDRSTTTDQSTTEG